MASKLKNSKFFSKALELRNHLITNMLQHPLFCVVKVPVLHCKRAYIEAQNRHFCFIKQFLLF
jgi:hypothetical protein